jgi:hypothetical protein
LEECAQPPLLLLLLLLLLHRMNLEWKKLRYLSEKLRLTPWYK